MADLKNLKGVSDKDRKMIADAEALLGPEPSTMGFVKNLFWGNLRREACFPVSASRSRREGPLRRAAGRPGSVPPQRTPRRPDRSGTGDPATG